MSLYNVTKLEDNYILVGISVSVLIVPIIYFLITTFTRNFSYLKVSMLVVCFATFFGGVVATGKDFTFIEVLNKHANTSGAIAIVFGLVVSLLLIAQDPYFSGLFGRFRDKDDYD